MPVLAATFTWHRSVPALLPDRLDVVHLGLGDDGHTASWPPGDPVIDAGGSVAVSGSTRAGCG
jgi:6-phosphogluconolactonase/glucosamine-6-phosphate isomerase/deaminase